MRTVRTGRNALGPAGQKTENEERMSALESGLPASNDDFGRAVSRILSARRCVTDGERIICLSSQYPGSGFRLKRAASRIPYLALLPMGFSVPRRSPGGRWALTPPFHPYRCTQISAAVCFLWHYPSKSLSAFLPRVSRSLRTQVTRHRALWSSDFPPPACAGSDSPPFQNRDQSNPRGDA